MLSIAKATRARGRVAGLVAAHRKLEFRKFGGAPSGRWWARDWPDSSRLPVGLSLDEARNPGQGVNARRRCGRLAGVPGLVSGLPGLRVLAHGWRLIHRPTVHQTSATAKTSAKGVSLYLCLPATRMTTHNRWLRIVINMTLQLQLQKAREAIARQEVRDRDTLPCEWLH
jgi:hypothetical protein